MTQPPSASSGIALWEERFGASDDYLYGTEPNRFLTAQAPRLAPGSTILAVADGEGRNGVWLAGQGHRVTAIDGSAAALQKSRRLARRQGVELRHLQADLLTWDWGDEHYDAVVAIFIQFAGPEDRRRLFKGMVKALRPGGLLLLQGYRPEQLDYGTGGPSVVENLYTEEQLRQELEGLDFLHLHSHDSTLSEGTGHRGRSALIDLVARKPG